jgi:hypothetical protein
MSEHIKTEITTIEQAIQVLAYNPDWHAGFQVHGKDLQTIMSLAESQYAYTEKQGYLAVSVLKRYHTLFQKFGIDLTDLLDAPVFREPFRVIDYRKTIRTYEDENKKWIDLKFSYDKKLIELVRTLKHKKTDEMVPMVYEGEQRLWRIAHTEVTAYYCTLIAVRYDFEILDKELLDDYLEIRKEKLLYRPTVAKIINGQIQLQNAPESLTEWWNENYLDKNFILQSDALKQLEIVNDINVRFTEKSTLADRIALNKKRQIWVDRQNWTKKDLINSLQELDSLPALVMTGSEFSSFKEVQEVLDWKDAFIESGIEPNQIAWGFTVEDAPDWRKHNRKENPWHDTDPYPSELSDSAREELYHKWCEVRDDSTTSKYIDHKTKIIFVRSRIPRTLIKSKITPKTAFTILNNHYWPTGTESLARVVENLPKRIYYVSKDNPWLTNEKYEFL